MKKKIVISLLAFLFVNLSIMNVWGEGYQKSVEFQNSGNKKYKAIRLTREIVSSATSNLSDLLLKNEKEEVIPYFINQYTNQITFITKQYPLKKINSFIKEPDYYLDFTLENPVQSDILVNSITFVTSEMNFVKTIQLYGSYDNLNWESIQADLLYSVESNSKLQVLFARTLKYTHYRIQFNNRSDFVEFSSATLGYNEEIEKTEPFLETFEPKFSSVEKGKQTIITIEGIHHSKLLDITLETKDMFQRTVYFDHSYSKELYNLSFHNSFYKDLTIPLNGLLETSDFGTIVISNQDDKPIKITKIIVRRLVDEIVFDGSTSSRYVLQYSNPGISSPPSYDIVKYKDSIIKEGYDLLKLGEIKTVPPPPPPPPPPKPKSYKWLFNLIIIVVAILVGTLLIVGISKKK